MTQVALDSSGYAPIPLYVGAFALCPDDLIAQIIARVFSPENIFSAAKCIPLICKTFARISNEISTFNFCLDNELKEKTTLKLNDLIRYCSLFKQKCKKEVTLFEIFTRYPQLTHLEVSNLLVNNDDALPGLIGQAEKAGCKLQSLQLNSCPITTLDLARLSQIQYLKLSHCPDLTSLLNLNKLNHLKNLEVEWCPS